MLARTAKEVKVQSTHQLQNTTTQQTTLPKKINTVVAILMDNQEEILSTVGQNMMIQLTVLKKINMVDLNTVDLTTQLLMIIMTIQEVRWDDEVQDQLRIHKVHLNHLLLLHHGTMRQVTLPSMTLKRAMKFLRLNAIETTDHEETMEVKMN